jgi:serine/threonine protein phosphatase PrpC
VSPVAFAASIVGARHRRLGAAGDDAAGWSRSGTPAVLTAAVADGHSDPRCTRRQLGARFAVASAPVAAAEWWSDTADESDREPLAGRLVAQWRTAVDADLAQRPAGVDELRRDAQSTVSPRLLYGSTVLLATADDAAVTVLRIGDGDAVGVNHDGVAYRLLDADPAAMPGETASLGTDDAALVAQRRTMTRADGPELIVLVTDGVTDAYPDDDGLLGACRELHELWRDHGQQRAEESVVAWLHAAADYSGDDASAAAVRLWADP